MIEDGGLEEISFCARREHGIEVEAGGKHADNCSWHSIEVDVTSRQSEGLWQTDGASERRRSYLEVRQGDDC